FLAAFQPRLLVIMETELWPNIIHYSKQRGTGVVIANARLSEKSARGYAKFPALGGPMLAQIDCIGVQARNDGERFRRLGVEEARITITGSIKFEIDLPATLQQKQAELRALVEGERPIWIAASTRDGEEDKVLTA